MKNVLAVLVVSVVGVAQAALPPPSDEAKGKAAETAAKAAWADKVGLYQLCVAMDRTADAYRRNLKASGAEVPAPQTTPPCVDPGPYTAQSTTPQASKPLEAAGAHSPPGTATSPPNTKTPAAEIPGGAVAKGG
jgi:hypothetical protein